jgi:hypothetical protein
MRVEHHQRRPPRYEPVSRLDLGPGSFIDEPKCSHSAPDTWVHNLAVELTFRKDSLADFCPGDFHPTLARALFESSEAIVAACLGLAGGILLTRFLLTKSLVISRRATPEFNPPTSWWLASDEKTPKDVMRIINAAFEMASKAPPRLRDQAYGEASFMVPYEIASLNLDAPRTFKVEEMAPLSSLRKQWQVFERGGIQIRSPFNVETDARAFLYFPNGSAEATAAFLAILLSISLWNGS